MKLMINTSSLAKTLNNNVVIKEKRITICKHNAILII
jgi:hypothetical protein